MREILFRGRNKHSSEWEFGCYYKQTEFYGDEIEDHVIITSHEELSYDQALVCYSVQPETIGQFTGLTDKNGKKIFEGDIVVDHFHVPAVVEFTTEDVASCGCCYPVFNGSGFKAKDTYLDACEIIGNIHDNPELLEEE